MDTSTNLGFDPIECRCNSFGEFLRAQKFSLDGNVYTRSDVQGVFKLESDDKYYHLFRYLHRNNKTYVYRWAVLHDAGSSEFEERISMEGQLFNVIDRVIDFDSLKTPNPFIEFLTSRGFTKSFDVYKKAGVDDCYQVYENDYLYFLKCLMIVPGRQTLVTGTIYHMKESPFDEDTIKKKMDKERMKI